MPYPIAGHLQGGHGFHEAGRETSKATRAQAGLFFMLDQFVEIDSQFFDGSPE